jgi:molybdopterin molybdotransferase
MPSEVIDVRMKGFARRASVDEAVDLIRQRVVSLPAERCSWSSLADRVLAESLSSPVDLPAFPRSAMDGYAVRSPAQPGQDYTIIGEAFPGRPFAGEVSPGQAVRIMTGAPIPTGADCVVPVEQTECSPTTVRLKETFPSGKNCIRVGEDVSAGQQLLPAGRRLRPQDLGLLAAVGLADVAVVRRPRVALYITGKNCCHLARSLAVIRLLIATARCSWHSSHEMAETSATSAVFPISPTNFAGPSANPTPIYS